MVLNNLRNRYCCVCKKRGESIGSKKVFEIKNENMIDKVAYHFKLDRINLIHDQIMCYKHLKSLNKAGFFLDKNINVISNNTLVEDNSNDESNPNIVLENYDHFDSRSTDKGSEEFENVDDNDDNDYCNKSIEKKKINIEIDRISNSHGYCFICKSESGSTPFSKISNEGIIDVFIKTNIFIPIDSRCCKFHLTDSKWLKDEYLNNISSFKNSVNLNKTMIQDLFKSFRSRDSKTASIFAKFSEINNVTTEFCFQNTGFTKDEFLYLVSELKTIKNSFKRSKEQALAVYLFWLKTGLDQNSIACYFGLSCRSKVQKYCHQIKTSLSADFVEKNLGAKSQSRKDWLLNNTDMIKDLFDLKEEQLAIIADGTYLFCEKSSNNTLQRKLYSGQKKRHLVKPFVVCTANGFIIDVYGPFAATMNDATILSNILKTKNDIRELVEPNDLFILDRGFRDIVDELKTTYKVFTKMPTCSKSQLTSLQANHTRFVTKCKWVIEAVNGTFKQSFKSLEKTRNTMLPHIMTDVRIAASLINCFHVKYISDKKDGKDIAILMKIKINFKDDLESYILNTKNKSKKHFEPIDALDLNDFPKFSIDDMRKYITFGSYQIKQSYSYLAEHLNKNGIYIILIDKNIQQVQNYKLISAEIQSRHSNATKYRLYIKYLPNIDSPESVLSWACGCFSGLRTCGCCSHIASIILYLCCGKYLEKLPNPGSRLMFFL
ncbi:uncharacterized protein LOC136091722 [Hydra vulgaris]|uniref:Uncharacterized protein LOC136091722 n=1 Tax=Hydra vulgaris TaxID=6087 RepID=A0ABM4DLS9_HYDVU